jgi:hypothetical protein
MTVGELYYLVFTCVGFGALGLGLGIASIQYHRWLKQTGQLPPRTRSESSYSHARSSVVDEAR